MLFLNYIILCTRTLIVWQNVPTFFRTYCFDRTPKSYPVRSLLGLLGFCTEAYNYKGKKSFPPCVLIHSSKRVEKDFSSSFSKTSTYSITRSFKSMSNHPPNILYFPLYKGWVFKRKPFFHHPFEALCWQFWNVCHDGINYYWVDSPKVPKWHKCVGCVPVEAGDSVEQYYKNPGLWKSVLCT